MKCINQFLTEFYPKNPTDIVIKNSFYPRGLTELQVYKYYLSTKHNLLHWIGDRNIAFLMKIGNDTVLIRNQKGKPIYLTNSNFEDLITGRTNVIYVTHPQETNYWVVDIDVGPNLTMKHCKMAHDILLNKLSSWETKKTESIITSPKGIHFIGYLEHTSNIDLLRESLKNELLKISDDINKKSNIQFTVNVKGRNSNKINFDLSSMYSNSLHIARYSLTKEFLVCDSIEKGIKRVK